MNESHTLTDIVLDFAHNFERSTNEDRLKDEGVSLIPERAGELRFVLMTAATVTAARGGELSRSLLLCCRCKER